ncbi:unnamed protein product [Cyprideis torosa]|uniref:Uncharacterized protein n=1 Tax=Cyprideis torosa TaxID=163714 RepID=A0A7R8W5E4_9CRUS|nr:unnamed protein product [Cyprideis torosa]CAG0885175.1 unnamed protein product [Cyprideis torosa]
MFNAWDKRAVPTSGAAFPAKIYRTISRQQQVQGGRSNLPPEKVPWEAISRLLSQCIYGGKIDNEFDQRLLASFLAKLFVPASFESHFPLGPPETELAMPEGIRRDQFLSWIEALGHRQTPAWLGLPTNAETVLLIERGHDMIGKLLKMQLLEDDEEDLAYEATPMAVPGAGETKTPEGRPSWMKTLAQTADGWLGILPKEIPIGAEVLVDLEKLKDEERRKIPLISTTNCFERDSNAEQKTPGAIEDEQHRELN